MMKGVQVLDLFKFPLQSTFIGDFFFLPGLGSFHLVPFSPPFLGALFYSRCLIGFHQLKEVFGKALVGTPIRFLITQNR
jgi:hypothetical protein